MLDLPSKNPPESPAASAPARGQRLWGVLLVLDSFLVIIFGGALAAKIYQFWQVPPPEIHRRAPRLHEAPKPEPAKTAEAPKPEPPKAPTAAKPPEPSPAPAKTGVPAPKPSVVQEPAKPHQAPAPMGDSAGDAKPLKAKAGAAEFTDKSTKARKVELAGAFLRGGRKAMVLDGGVWTLTVYLTPNVYRYHFIVDGRKRLDPDNPKTERGASARTVP
jgi:outer membrane biosynthesis protein TonB